MVERLGFTLVKSWEGESLTSWEGWCWRGWRARRVMDKDGEEGRRVNTTSGRTESTPNPPTKKARQSRFVAIFTHICHHQPLQTVFGCAVIEKLADLGSSIEAHLQIGVLWMYNTVCYTMNVSWCLAFLHHCTMLDLNMPCSQGQLVILGCRLCLVSACRDVLGVRDWGLGVVGRCVSAVYAMCAQFGQSDVVS